MAVLIPNGMDSAVSAFAGLFQDAFLGPGFALIFQWPALGRFAEPPSILFFHLGTGFFIENLEKTFKPVDIGGPFHLFPPGLVN